LASPQYDSCWATVAGFRKTSQISDVFPGGRPFLRLWSDKAEAKDFSPCAPIKCLMPARVMPKVGKTETG